MSNYCDLFFFFYIICSLFSTVQEMTCIFNDMAKTKPKIKHNKQQKKTNITNPPNTTNKYRKAAVAKIMESINRLTSLEGQGRVRR